MASGTLHKSDSQVFRAAEGESEVARAAEMLDWPLRGVIDADPAAGVPYEAQWGIGTGPTLHYVMHGLSDSSFFFASADDPMAAASAAGLAAPYLDVETFDELLADVDRAKGLNQIGRALLRAALGAPEAVDMRLVDRISNTLRDRDPQLREAAIWAITIQPWTDYRLLLTKLAADDRDQRIRDLAQVVLEGYEAHLS
ncbi:hypothetical protein [Catenulispora rubra]|uniref:hypothetical protein n=1 Tax=Catenulispora rubra TaxID=280293 RepID=UPI001892062B|nr:hypothetical protein [Catenulispora rubra]